VRLEDIVLLFRQTWFHIDGETGQMVCKCSMMLVIEVRLCVVVIGEWIRLSAEMWVAEIDVVIVVCICGICVELHGEIERVLLVRESGISRYPPSTLLSFRISGRGTLGIVMVVRKIDCTVYRREVCGCV